MKLVPLAALAAVTLSACAPTLQAVNERGGVVKYGVNARMNDALALADAQCQQHGRVARITSQDAISTTLAFECVSPEG